MGAHHHDLPSRAGSPAPTAALLPSVPCTGAPGEGSARCWEACVCPPSPDLGLLSPWPPELCLFGALCGHCGRFPLGCCHPVTWARRPLSCPQDRPASGRLSGCSRDGASPAFSPRTVGPAAGHSSPGAEPARPPVAGGGVWPAGVHRGESTASPPVPKAPGWQAHPPLPSLGRPPEPSLGGWRGETQDGGTRPLRESHGGW